VNDVPGRAYGFQGRRPEAGREYRAMIAQDLELPETRWMSAAPCMRKKRAETHREFSEAIRLDAGYAAAYANRGLVSVKRGRA